MRVQSFVKNDWSFGIDPEKVADELQKLAGKIRAKKVVPMSASIARTFTQDEFTLERLTLDFTEQT